MQDSPLPENPAASARLAEVTSHLSLLCATGKAHVPFAEKIHGKTYLCSPNHMGITSFSLVFTEDGGVFRYTNAQGDKELPFGLCRNVFCKFPQYGYSDGVGGMRTTDGFLYDAAVSAAWREEQKLVLRVQIIDRYFGNLRAIFAFREDRVVVNMLSTAEDFLGEYHGMLLAEQKKESPC